MVERKRTKMTRRDIISASIYSPLIILQFVLTVFFYQNYYDLDLLEYAGWIVWLLSIYFAIAPMIILKRRGGVPKGKSYMQTSRLVKNGLYGIVRHPQYTGGLLLMLAMMMVSQHPVVVISGLIAIPIFYVDIAREDRRLVRLFGNEYRRYMKRVPRTNFILGLARACRRRSRR